MHHKTGYCLDNVYIFSGSDIANAFSTSTPITALPKPFIENPASALDGEINGPFGIAFFAASAEKPTESACVLPSGLNELYVDASHSGPFVGTASDPFATIQDAVNAVTAPTVINVANGTYLENLDITTSDIHFRGAGQNTIIDGPADLAGVRPGDIIVSADGYKLATVSDLTRLLKQEFRVGQKIDVELFRDEGNEVVNLVLGERPTR